MESKPYRHGGGRKPSGIAYPVRITVMLTEEMRAHLERCAEKRDRTTSEIVRELIARDMTGE